MVDLATPIFQSKIMLPDVAMEDQRAAEGPVPGTPPRSPSRNNNSHRRLAAGTKEDDAVESLMKLATPVKSPLGSGNSITPGARGMHNGNAQAAAAYGAEMTPVSIFRKSRQLGEPGHQLQSPLQSPYPQSFNFSPTCLFSPPAAGGTLDIPTGDTPGPSGSTRDTLWQQQTATTPDRSPRQPRDGSGISSCNSSTTRAVVSGSGRGTGGGDDGGGGDDDYTGGVPGSCSKRKGKALFTDRRGPQDHSRLGQAWCLGTPGRPSAQADAASVVHHHLGVTNDIPATPDRVPGVDGASVLPPTPQLLPPTPPPRGTRHTVEAAATAGGGDGAAGILMGLRSPESSSTFIGNSSNIAHSLFAGLDENYDARAQSSGDGMGLGRGDHSRGWSDDWSEASGEPAQRSGFGGCVGEVHATHSAPSKRYRRWASPVLLRNSHCKGSFKIEGMTLIRTGSSSSVGGAGAGGGEGSSSSGGGGGGSSIASRKRGAIGADRANCRVRSRGQSIADEPLSPRPTPVLSPEAPALAISRRSMSLSPANKQPLSRSRGASAASTAPCSAPRPSRASRADRSRGRGGAVMPAASSNPSVSPSLGAAANFSKATPSRCTPGRSTPGFRTQRKNSSSSLNRPTLPEQDVVRVSSPLKFESVESSSYSSPEPTSSRREKAAASSVGSGKPSVTVDSKPVGGGLKVGEGQVEENGQRDGEEGGAMTCNCKKSKCLKLYCECFQRRQYCMDCNCQECYNTPRTEDVRQGAIQSTIERNPTAFVSKFEKRAGGKRSHNAGCNCKKSACLKKYCECFQAGVACAANCKCSNCKNYEGAAGGRKRRAPEPSAATIVQQTPRTPPRTSSRNRGAEVEEMASAGTSSPDTHHVQVGDDDDNEDDDGDSSDNDTAVQIDVKIKIPDIFETSRGGNNENDPIPKKVPDHTSGSSGGGDPSDTPPSTAAAAATMVAKAAFRRDDEGDGAGPSPSAASTIADCAVARSLLEMGGTQLQARESREDRRFELSVVTGSPGEVSVGGIKESAGNSSDDGAAGVDGPTATGGFSGIGEVDGIVEGDEDNSILGMTASVSRARRDRDKKKTSRSRESGSLVMDVVKNEDGHEERAGDGNGGLVASGESEAGGQCLTPPTTTTVNGGATWKTNKLPGLDFGAAPGGIVDADGSGSGVNAVSVRRSNGRGNCGVLESEASLVDTFGVI